MKLLTTYFHVAYGIIGIIAFLMVLLGKMDHEYKEYISAIFLLVYILIAFLYILLQSRYKNKKQNLFSNFWRGDIAPRKKGEDENLDSIPKIVIIDDEDNNEPIFITLKDDNDLILNQSEDDKDHPEDSRKINEKPFIVLRLICKSSGETKQKNLLNDTILPRAKAVVFARTKGMEQKKWVYPTVDFWAIQHGSQVPILYVEKLTEEEQKNKELSPIPEKFYAIQDEVDALPWNLLQRANERSSDWKNVALFSRVIGISATVIFFVTLFISCYLVLTQAQENTTLTQAHNAEITELNASLFQNQINENYNLIKEIYQSREINKLIKKSVWARIAQQTKDRYKKLANLKDEKLNVSYWLRYDGKIKQLITSEVASTHQDFDDDKKSAIGCGFAYSNHTTEWDKSYNSLQIKIWDIKNMEKWDPQCTLYDEPNRKLTAIICDSHNSTPEHPEFTVGICVFTESDNNIFGDNSRPFLRERTREFFEVAYPLIKDKKLTPLIDIK